MFTSIVQGNISKAAIGWECSAQRTEGKAEADGCMVQDGSSANWPGNSCCVKEKQCHYRRNPTGWVRVANSMYYAKIHIPWVISARNPTGWWGSFEILRGTLANATNSFCCQLKKMWGYIGCKRQQSQEDPFSLLLHFFVWTLSVECQPRIDKPWSVD